MTSIQRCVHLRYVLPLSTNPPVFMPLCDFKVSKKEFMSQHWYYCHTCKMVDRIGVCSVCAKVCHAGHDISYAKYGSFFCDCGDKDDETTTKTRLAINKRDQVKTQLPNSASPTATSVNKIIQQVKPQPLLDLTTRNIFSLNATDVQRTRKQVENLREHIIELVKAHINKLIDKGVY